MRRISASLLLLFLLQAGYIHAQKLVPFLKGTEWHLYNKSTRTLQSDTYQAIVPGSCGLLFVEKDGKWGAIDGTQKNVLPLKYADVRQLNKEVLYAHDEKGIHLFDTLGQPISKAVFLEASVYIADSSLVVVCNTQKKYGIIDSHGKTKLDFLYDFAPEHLGSYLIVGQKSVLGEKQVGLVDSVFHSVLAVKYSKISLLEDIYFVAHELKGDYVLLNQKSKELYRGEGEPVQMYSRFIFLRGEKTSGIYVKATKKSFLFPWGYYYRIWDEQGLVVYINNEERITRFINANGDTSSVSGYIVSTKETYTAYFPVEDRNKTSKYGMIDRTGKLVLPLQYDIILSWNDTHLAAGRYSQTAKGRETKFSLIEIVTGKDMLGRTCEDIQLFPLGGIALKDNGVYHLYDSKLKQQDSREFVSVVSGRSDWLFIDKPGKTLYPVKVKMTSNTARDYCVGYIDGTCHLVFQPVYRNIVQVKDNYNNRAPFDRLVGNIFDSAYPYPVYYRSVLLAPDGRQLSDPRYSGAGQYTINNLIPVYADVQYEDEWRRLVGMMDTMGNIVIPAQYDEITELRPGRGFILKLNGRTTFADQKGKRMPGPMQYGYFQPMNASMVITTLGAKKGLLDAQGKIIVAFAYDEILQGPLMNGTLFKVRRNKIDFYVDRDGTEYYEP